MLFKIISTSKKRKNSVDILALYSEKLKLSKLDTTHYIESVRSLEPIFRMLVDENKVLDVIQALSLEGSSSALICLHGLRECWTTWEQRHNRLHSWKEDIEIALDKVSAQRSNYAPTFCLECPKTLPTHIELLFVLQPSIAFEFAKNQGILQETDRHSVCFSPLFMKTPIRVTDGVLSGIEYRYGYGGAGNRGITVRLISDSLVTATYKANPNPHDQGKYNKCQDEFYTSALYAIRNYYDANKHTLPNDSIDFDFYKTTYTLTKDFT